MSKDRIYGEAPASYSARAMEQSQERVEKMIEQSLETARKSKEQANFANSETPPREEQPDELEQMSTLIRTKVSRDSRILKELDAERED
jgi:hypothetical protein